MSTDKGPNMELRAFLAVVLSLGFMIVYQFFFAPPPAVPPPERSLPAAAEPSTELPATRPAEPAETGAAATAAPAAPPPEEVVVADREQTIVLETRRFRMIVSNRGALITSYLLKDFEADYGGGPVELVVPQIDGHSGGMLRLLTPDAPGLAAGANEALYEVTVNGAAAVSNYRVEAPTHVTWRWRDGGGWSVDKRLTVHPDGYLSELAVTVANPLDVPAFVSMGPGLERNADTSRAGIYLVAGAVLFDGTSPEHLSDGEIARAAATEDGDPSEAPGTLVADLVWGGIQSHYFAALFVPESPAMVSFDSIAPTDAGAGEPGADAGGEEEPALGVPGTRARFGIAVPAAGLELPLYLGPKQFEVLAAESHRLERAVDYGMFRFLARPLAVAIGWVQGFVGNWGLAIILVTVLVRLIFWPLSQRSMISMRKMQQLQPQMNAIRAKYRGAKEVEKRQQMNQEIMALYKDHGVSPLGGCLPMLLQMPVLFGFYAAVSVSIELRHAPLGLWVQDLSKMDPYYVLPLLMGASMYAQQRMSPASGDKTQQMVFRMMPVMFTFFFLYFPSGLVVYWLINTVLGIAQQAYVNHQIGGPPATSSPAPAKGKSAKRKKGGGGKRKKRGNR